MYVCRACELPLASPSAIESTNFTGRSGPAILFRAIALASTRGAPAEERHLLTGVHRVTDLACAACGASVGWR
jgi:hypothetical protein